MNPIASAAKGAAKRVLGSVDARLGSASLVSRFEELKHSRVVSVWIGANCAITSGTTIGSGAIVAAGIKR